MWGASPPGSEAVRSLTGTVPSGSHSCSFSSETSDPSSSTGEVAVSSAAAWPCCDQGAVLCCDADSSQSSNCCCCDFTGANISLLPSAECCADSITLPAGCPADQYTQRSFILPEVRPLLNLSKHTFCSNDGAEDDLLMSVGTHGKASVKGIKLIDSATSASKVRGSSHGSIQTA